MHSEVAYAYGMWIVAAFNVGLFVVFNLSFLRWLQPLLSVLVVTLQRSAGEGQS